MTKANKPDQPLVFGSTDGLGVTAPKRCTEREECQGADTRYDTVSSGVYSLTLKCRACGFVVRHDWD